MAPPATMSSTRLAVILVSTEVAELSCKSSQLAELAEFTSAQVSQEISVPFEPSEWKAQLAIITPTAETYGPYEG